MYMICSVGHDFLPGKKIKRKELEHEVAELSSGVASTIVAKFVFLCEWRVCVCVCVCLVFAHWKFVVIDLNDCFAHTAQCRS